MITKNNEIGIYVHIPFCKKKCNYCDFISYCDKGMLISDYIESVIKEIESQNIQSKITTVYIGGGTPSYIDSKYIIKILEKIKEKNISEDAEITIEVNPGTVTEKKLKDYINCGINRLSIGLQSTKDEILKEIGRIHEYADFLNTYNMAKKIGFNNMNVDLMIGLPNQKIIDIKESLEKILELNPNHISVYSLILEEGTSLFKKVEDGVLKIPDEELERNMYWYVKNTLELNGYKHYEISNFAKEGYESKHNLNCWNQKEYIGIGCAAHSYKNITRYSNTENIEEYINNIHKKCFEKNRIIHEVQTEEDARKEFMLLGLRKVDGVKINEFKNKFGDNPIYLYRNQLNKLSKENLIIVDNDDIRLSNRGIDLANLVWEEFI